MQSLSVTIILAFIALASGSVHHSNTVDRLVYASWSTCDACTCHYFTLTSFEYDQNNGNNGGPTSTAPYYLYYIHNSYDTCADEYSEEYIYRTTDVGLEVSGSSKSARLYTGNITDTGGNNVRFQLSWSSCHVDNKGNCNCHSIYSTGLQTFKYHTKNGYREAQVIGSIFINENEIPVPDNIFGYIYKFGLKTIEWTD